MDPVVRQAPRAWPRNTVTAFTAGAAREGPRRGTDLRLLPWLPRHSTSRRRTEQVTRPTSSARARRAIRASAPPIEPSVHAQAVKAGNALSPVCSDCHSAHRHRGDVDRRLEAGIVRECGTCHEASLRTYRDTFHGKVTDLGYTRVAKCADCHGAHGILPASNPASTIAPGAAPETCRTCHANASESFAQYDPHADPQRSRRNPVLHDAADFMHAAARRSLSLLRRAYAALVAAVVAAAPGAARRGPRRYRRETGRRRADS